MPRALDEVPVKCSVSALTHCPANKCALLREPLGWDMRTLKRCYVKSTRLLPLCVLLLVLCSLLLKLAELEMWPQLGCRFKMQMGKPDERAANSIWALGTLGSVAATVSAPVSSPARGGFRSLCCSRLSLVVGFCAERPSWKTSRLRLHHMFGFLVSCSIPKESDWSSLGTGNALCQLAALLENSTWENRSFTDRLDSISLYVFYLLEPCR